MKYFKIKKAIPLFAIALIITGALITYSLLSNKETDNKTEDGRGTDSGIDMAAAIKNQFVIEDKHYIILSDEQRSEFGLPSTINEGDIGDSITTITTSVDADLLGSEVYQYLPAGGEAVVVVKKEKDYKLFKFFTFESYNNNQDEDVSAYLELYGINSAIDIAKIQFINRSEKAKLEGKLDINSEITDNKRITEFYNYYSVIKNSSDNYFVRLFNYKGSNNMSQDTLPKQTELPPDYREGADDIQENNINDAEVDYADDLLPEDINSKDIPLTDILTDAIYDYGETGVGSSIEGSAGSVGNALNNSVTIRIYNQSGLYFDAEYYPNLGFISRHEVNDDFADFLKNMIG